MTTLPRLAASIAAGLVLAAIPFARYIHPGGGEAHANHEARHGGQLGMAGDHHLEFVRRGRHVEIYVSDARRNPLTARRGTLDYGDGIVRRLRWDETLLRGPYVLGAESVNTLVVLEDGEEAEIEFWLSTPD